MDDFQFIIESPQQNEGHKKRPRLVTSCDNCRLKKIKCLQSGSSSNSKCEACKLAKIPCRFRDRERYFAERSRAISGPAPGSRASYHERSSSRSSSNSDQASRPNSNPVFDGSSQPSSLNSSTYSLQSMSRSSSHSPRASGVVYAAETSGTRYQSYPPDPRRIMGAHAGSPPSGYSFAPSRVDSPAYTRPHLARHASEALSIENPRNVPLVPLFDPQHIQCPHSTLMPHFIQIFIEQFGGQCPFAKFDELMAQFFDQSLSPLLSNAIAALAVRFSDLPDLTARGVHNVAQNYGNNAKNILSSIMHIPTVDTLHGLILLAWFEYKADRVADFRSYAQMSMRMAIDLGISDDATIQLSPSERDRDRLRATWTSIVQLHFFASSLDA